MDQAGEVVAALGHLRVEARELIVDRPEATEHLAEVAGLSLQPLADPDKEDAQVRLGVGVQGVEDLVEVDLRRGVGERDRVAVLESRPAGDLLPGSSSMKTSCRPVRGRISVVALR